jgi:pilus assembly protein CpaF
MIKVTVNEKGGGERVLAFDKDLITIGRSQRNDVILPRSNVSKKHATVALQGTGLLVTDNNSTNGTFVNGRRLSAPVALSAGDKVFVSDFVLVMEGIPGAGADLESTFPPPLPPPPDEPPARPVPGAATVPPVSAEPPEEIEPEEIEPEEEPDEIEPLEEPERPPAAAGREADAGEVEREAFKELDAILDLDRVEPQAFRDADFQKKTKRTIAEVVDAMLDAGRIPGEKEPSEIASRLTSEILGLGLLDGLLGDGAVWEIIVPARGPISIRTVDGIRPVRDSFLSDRSRLLAMRKLRAMIRGQHGETGAAVSGVLEGGEEVFMLLPPVVLEGAAAVIRKFPGASGGGIEELVEREILSRPMARFLGYCIEARQGVLVCDPGLGSHRTLVPAVASMLEPWERLVALQCGRAPLYDLDPHLYAILPSGEDSLGIDVTASDLVQVVGAFRPTTLIAGDIRSIDHFRLIRQASSARAFTLATIDAESEMDGLARMGGWLAREHSVIPRAVATGIMLDAIDIVLFYSRMMDGTETLTRISELVPGKEGLPTLKPVFVYDVGSVSTDGVLQGAFRATNHVPSFIERSKGRGKGGRFDTGIFK